MRHFINIFALLFIAFGIYSCTSSKKLIEKQQTEFGSVQFYAVSVSNGNSLVDKIYADTDSNGVKRFYSFYPDRIVMTDERAKELSYTISFRKLSDNFDGNVYNHLSTWDTLVFSKVMTILKTFKYSHLKRPDGATSYEIEVNYLHGFPKSKTFQAL